MMRFPARAAAWAAIAGFALVSAPADGEQRIPLDRRGHQEQRFDHGRARHDAAEAAAGFLGLFLGLLGGLQDQGQAQAGCDPGAFYGWAQTRHPAHGYGFSYPSHWQQAQVNEPNIVQAIVNPCPPHAAVIIARSEVNRMLSQQELEATMALFQKEGGVFRDVRLQEPVPAPGQTRRKGLFSGSDGGVEMAALVHLVSVPTGLFLVVGIAPDAAGEKAGTMLRYAVESFVPPQAFAPGG